MDKKMDKNEKSRVKNGNDWKCQFCDKIFVTYHPSLDSAMTSRDDHKSNTLFCDPWNTLATCVHPFMCFPPPSPFSITTVFSEFELLRAALRTIRE